MPAYIIKLADRYLEYSTICDAPITVGMTRDEFRAYYVEKYGTSSERDMDGRLERTDAKGTSSRIHNSVADVICYNRAGKNETRLTLDQIVDFYVTRRGEGPEPVGEKIRP